MSFVSCRFGDRATSIAEGAVAERGEAAVKDLTQRIDMLCHDVERETRSGGKRDRRRFWSAVAVLLLILASFLLGLEVGRRARPGAWRPSTGPSQYNR